MGRWGVPVGKEFGKSGSLCYFVPFVSGVSIGALGRNLSFKTEEHPTPPPPQKD